MGEALAPVGFSPVALSDILYFFSLIFRSLGMISFVDISRVGNWKIKNSKIIRIAEFSWILAFWALDEFYTLSGWNTDVNDDELIFREPLKCLHRVGARDRLFYSRAPSKHPPPPPNGPVAQESLNPRSQSSSVSKTNFFLNNRPRLDQKPWEKGILL